MRSPYNESGQMILTKQKNSTVWCSAYKKQISVSRARKLVEEGKAVMTEAGDLFRKSTVVAIEKKGLCEVCEVSPCHTAGVCLECDRLYSKPLYTPKMRKCGKCGDETVNYFNCDRCTAFYIDYHDPEDLL